jgi:hypothetical protein
MRYADQSTTNAFAVLVGDFTKSSTPDLEQDLKILKFANPKSLGGDGSNPGRALHGKLSDVKRLLGKPDSENNIKPGPMYRTAFATRNPLLPQDFFQPPKVDKFVKELNDQVEFSLLKNPGRFTLRVATFRGEESVIMGNRKAIDEETMQGEALENGANMADLAVRTLRKQGIEAYQFHDRSTSLVTIGQFPSIGSSDSQGQFIELPEITQWKTRFGGPKDIKTSQMGQIPVAKTLLDFVNYRSIPELNQGTQKEKMRAVKKYSVPFDPNPTVMAVPKFEAKSLYQGSLLGSN